jgi:hypothetical protein
VGALGGNQHCSGDNAASPLAAKKESGTYLKQFINKNM